ncbi:hypothetical protein [Janibacter melonis]|uniref:hypothetical protein n=1 Tax=Janibacter melonis TaxID=262209 RepID=UPI0020957E3A|nr:hypothetical protein [Janibacter melonis]
MTPPHHDVDRLLADIRTGSLRVTRRTSAIALLLHGGRSVKTQPDRFRDISYLRMLPFGMAVMRASRGRVAPTSCTTPTAGGSPRPAAGSSRRERSCAG